MAWVTKTAGTRFYIGPEVNVFDIIQGTDEAALAAFEAYVDNDWTEVEQIEGFGDLGDTSNTNAFTSVKDTREITFVTTRSGSTLAVVCGLDPLDDGQIALADAQKEGKNYAFKIVYNDVRAAGYSPSTDYFVGIVLSKPKNLGGVQDVTKRTFNIKLQTDLYEDPTDPTGS